MRQRRIAVPLAALAALGLCGLAEAAPARRRPTFGKTERGPGAASGFKLEGPPKLVSLFGDTTSFTHDVDHYLALYESMQRVRDDFSRAVQTAIAELAAHQAAAGPAGTRTCPLERVALPFALSFHLGEDFRRSSGELGRVHGTLNAAFGANRSEVFGLALALLAQFLERHPLAEAEMGLSDVREMIFRE